MKKFQRKLRIYIIRSISLAIIIRKKNLLILSLLFIESIQKFLLQLELAYNTLLIQQIEV